MTRRPGAAAPAAVALAAALAALALAARPAQAAPTRLVVLPLRDATLGGAGARIEAAVIEAVQAMPGLQLANLANGRLTGPRRPEARMDPAPSARAVALGREAGARRAVVVEANPLGDGLVVYLRAIELPGGRALGSTTLSLAGGATRAPGDRELLRAALTRILDPTRYVGRLALQLDVPGAEAQVDGRPLAARSIALPVGTHALRVTHPKYHDFLRFVDIAFDQTQTVEVNMAAYPLTEGEMAERLRRNRAPVPHKLVPWWRSWWALTLSGVVLTGATIGVVWLARPWLSHGDGGATYTPTPTP